MKKTLSPQQPTSTVRAWTSPAPTGPRYRMRATADTFKEYGNPSTDKHARAISATGVKAEYNAWGDDSVRIDLAVVHPGQLEEAIEAPPLESNWTRTRLDRWPTSTCDRFFSIPGDSNNSSASTSTAPILPLLSNKSATQTQPSTVRHRHHRSGNPRPRHTPLPAKNLPRRRPKSPNPQSSNFSGAGLKSSPPTRSYRGRTGPAQPGRR